MKIEDMEYGYCFHLYLRKYSDTDWSVIMWNMINIVIEHDADQHKKDRVWRRFCEWCNTHWHNNPAMPFYDVAVAWTELEYQDPLACPSTSCGYMFRKALILMDAETRNDLNGAAEYDLEEQ